MTVDGAVAPSSARATADPRPYEASALIESRSLPRSLISGVVASSLAAFWTIERTVAVF